MGERGNSVNTSMLEFYWSIGRDLVAMRTEERMKEQYNEGDLGS